MQECKPKYRRHCPSAILGIDARQDGVQSEELPGRVQVDDLIHQRMRGPWRRKAPSDRLADLAARGDGLGQPHVAVRRVGRPQLGPAQLLVALGASILTGDGPERLRRPKSQFRQGSNGYGDGGGLASPAGAAGGGGVTVGPGPSRNGLPDHRLQDHGTAAPRACARVQRLDRPPDRGARERGVGERHRRGVDLAQVRRPKHRVGEQPRQRPGLEVGSAALLCYGGPCYPAATAVQVEDDLTGFGPSLDRGHKLRRGGRRGKSLESGQRRNVGELWLGVSGGTPDHASIVTDGPLRE